MPGPNFYTNLNARSDFVVKWRQMREYPLYQVSNTGRFRNKANHTEVARDSWGVTYLYHSGRDYWEVVWARAMANRYFYGNQLTKRIAETSCLASS